MRFMSAPEPGTSSTLARKPPTAACQPSNRDSSARMIPICASVARMWRRVWHVASRSLGALFVLHVVMLDSLG